MKQLVNLVYLIVALLVLGGCGDGTSVRQLPHLGNTPYQQDTILVTYATEPERALRLLDSAMALGNISDYRGQFIRATIYSKSLMEQQQDSAISICKTLLTHDSVRNEPVEKENILDILIATARAKSDDEAYLQWATQKVSICQQQSEETERWRTEAEIGLVMTHLGQVSEGLKKLDEAISRLDSPGSINRMDAFIIAVKRKINALSDMGRNEDVIPLAQRILDRLDHYEQHAKDYAEDSYRLSWSDHPADRDRYLDFCRAQAWAFMAQAYAQKSHHGDVKTEKQTAAEKAHKYLALFAQSGYSKTFMARQMIAPAQMALDMYDEALATYDEMENRMGADTLNADYALILRSRAIASRSKGHIAEALDYQTRYANLSKQVSDSLHNSQAHDYAARYHAQEQQLKIQERQAEAERSHIFSVALIIIALMAIIFAVYFFRQKRIVSEKNRALMRLINGLPAAEFSSENEEADRETEEESVSADTAFFHHIEHTIRTERLYANVNLQRQDIMERFGISRHALNDLMNRYAGGLTFPQFINTIRLEEAKHILDTQGDTTLTAIAEEVGFTPANFREQFKRCYGMTPAEYRKEQEEK